MKAIRYAFGLFASALALSVATNGLAHEAHKKDQETAGVQTSSEKKGKLIAVTETDAAWAAKSRKEYPIDVCVTSGDKLGSMGKSPEYIYRVEGRPDRLIVFCCAGCEEDFLKEPGKYLAILDAAATKKSTATK